MADTIQKILVVDNEKKFLNSITKRLKIMGFDPLKASVIGDVRAESS